MSHINQGRRNCFFSISINSTKYFISRSTVLALKSYINIFDNYSPTFFVYIFERHRKDNGDFEIAIPRISHTQKHRQSNAYQRWHSLSNFIVDNFEMK